MISFFLAFSDSAKYAEAARNLISGQGLVVHHSFFNSSLLQTYIPGQAWPAGFLPLPSWILAGMFKFFPAVDFTVAATGYLLFTVSLVLVFLIAKNIHSITSAIVSVALFASSLFFWEYAANGASEIFFTVEILLFVYLALQRTRIRWLAGIPAAVMWFTRPQAVLFILAAALYWFFGNLRYSRRNLIIVLLVGVFLTGWQHRFPFRPAYSAQTTAGVSQAVYLRGQAYPAGGFSVRSLAAKVGYNVYNFAKSPERLTHPAVWLLFLLALFWASTRRFAVFTAGVLVVFVLAAAATLPNARYVHPAIPLVLISAGGALAELGRKVKYSRGFILATLLFIALPTLSYFTVDARFRARQYNSSRPPVYKVISDIMAQNVPKGRLIITNLDAWAAWYQGLTTMWFPLRPQMLEEHADKVDYIVITNYLENDADFALGEWREVVYQPDNIQNQFLRENFRVLGTFFISSIDVYENQEYRGTILVRR